MTAPLPSVGQALDTLAELGDPDAIAAHLTQLGHRGWRRESDCCPVARYIQATTGEGVAICSVFWSGDAAGSRFEETPKPVADFLDRFDRGRYPALDENAAVPT